MLNGRITQGDSGPKLVVHGVGDPRAFDVEKLKDGVYELIDEKELIVDGLMVDLVITHRGQVIHYCESVTPEEVEDVEVH